MESREQIKRYVLQSNSPGALYSLSRLKKTHPEFSSRDLIEFYRENDVLRQFYGAKNIPKKKLVRNGYATYPLERIHIDLCEMTRQQGNSPYKYILFAVDNYSRYAFFVLLKSKKAHEMEGAAKQLLEQMSKFRTLSFNKSSVFMSDLGTEFVTTFKQVLLSRGHFFVNLATSHSKAFYVERFIRTFRTLLRIKQTSLDLDNRDFERWDTLVGDVLETYNCTPHNSLRYSTPLDYITLQKKTIAQHGVPGASPTPRQKRIPGLAKKVLGPGTLPGGRSRQHNPGQKKCFFQGLRTGQDRFGSIQSGKGTTSDFEFGQAQLLLFGRPNRQTHHRRLLRIQLSAHPAGVKATSPKSPLQKDHRQSPDYYPKETRRQNLLHSDLHT